MKLRLISIAFLLGCATAPPHDAPLRVLTFNIHAGKDAGGVENLDRLAAVIAATKADIVLLQEVDRNTTRSGHVDHLAVLERLTKFDGVYGKTIDFQGGEYGIAVLSRWPIVTHRVVAYRDDPSIEPRVALVVEVHGMRIVDTHLDASGDETFRRQEVEQLADLVRAESPQLAGGDFNSTPESAVHARMQESGMRDAWLQCGEGPGLTYPAAVPAKRIDYLYLAPGWTCTSATVIDTQASDHRPVLFTIRR